jgi:hypothetical protein
MPFAAPSAGAITTVPQDDRVAARRSTSAVIWPLDHARGAPSQWSSIEAKRHCTKRNIGCVNISNVRHVEVR